MSPTNLPHPEERTRLEGSPASEPPAVTPEEAAGVAPHWQHTLWAMVGIQFIMTSAFSMLTPILPLFLPVLGVESAAAINLWAGVLNGVTSFVAAFASPLWGRLGDRYGSRSVLQVTAPLFLACLLVWSVSGQPWLGEMLLPLLVILHVLMGVATAGVALATGTIAMKLSPIGRATSYLAANSVVTSVSASLAALAGGACSDFFAARELSLSITWKGPDTEVGFEALTFHSWTFFFALAFALGLIALRLLRAVKERGEVRETISRQQLVAEASRSLHSLSSVAGLHKLARFPFVLLRTVRR